MSTGVAERASVERYYADVSSRIAAHVVDAIIVSVIAFVAAVVISAALGPVVRFHSGASGINDRITVNRGRAVVEGAVSALLGAGYFALLWTRRAATVGQQVFGLEVRSRDGTNVGIPVAFVRWLLLVAPAALATALLSALPRLGGVIIALFVVWYLVLIVTAARHPHKRGIHDLIASTVVTKRGRPAI